MRKCSFIGGLLISIGLITQVLASDQTLVIPEVELTNSKPSLNTPSKTSAQTSQLKRKQLANSTVTNLPALLNQQQSIARLVNNSIDNSQTAVSIRGFGDNAAANSLILVDGFSLVNPSLLAPNLNLYELSDIERVDIFQGSAGVRWGEDAVGGVMNIITRPPAPDLAEVNLGYGSYNKKFLGFLLGDKFANGIFYKISGFGNSTDNYRQHNFQQNAGLSSQMGLDYARGSISINLQTYANQSELPGSLTQAQYDQNPRQASNHTSIIHGTTHIYQLLNQHELSDNWLLETRLSHRDIMSDGHMFLNFAGQDLVNSIDPRLTGTIYNNKIIMGYDGIASDYKLANGVDDDQVTTQQNDVYAQAVMPLVPRLEFTLGGRKAWQNNAVSALSGQQHGNDQALVSEQGLTYYPAPGWQLFVRRAGSFSFPKADEQTWLPPTQLTLLPQTGVSYEMGSQWHTARAQTQLNLYQLILTNEIAFDPNQTPATPFGSYSNLPKTSRTGITLTESYRINAKTTLASQLNYVNARLAAGPNSGNLIPAVPAFNGNVGVDYHFAEHWRSQYTAVYTGSSYPSDDTLNLGNKISGYWLQNIALQYCWRNYAHKPVKVGFELANIFNQKYAVFTTFDTETHANAYYPGAGRNYLLTVRAELD